MTAPALLSRLEAVRRTGSGRWIARCPAHADKSPSLAVRELDDGRTLAHCFAGCAIESILDAVGLDFDALFSERAIGDHVKRERRPFNAHDVLKCISTEALIVALAAAAVNEGKTISATDRERIFLASARIEAAREFANGE